MNIYVICTLGFAEDIITSLIRFTNIKGIIGLSNREESELISDFKYMKPFAEYHNISFSEVNSYNLRNDEDIKKLTSLKIDHLIVIGWQRLVPEWLINHVSGYVIGCHGSPFGITKGRGRSPQNWALILGNKNFDISIFVIDVGADSGPVIDTKTFAYNEFDDIKTSYYKVSLLTAQMLSNFFNGHIDEKNFMEQQHDEAEYLPQRLPEDGFIDWDRRPKEVKGFIDALTKPYPGARSKIKGALFSVFKAHPFNIDLDQKYVSGEIVKIFNKGDILVKVKQGFVLVNDINPDLRNAGVKEGDIFESHALSKQMKNIINRHNEKFPNLKISDKIMKLTKL